MCKQCAYDACRIVLLYFVCTQVGTWMAHVLAFDLYILWSNPIRSNPINYPHPSTKLKASGFFFRPRGPKPYFPATGPFKTFRGHVYMHLGCFLHRIYIWKLLKPLYTRWDPNICGFASPSGRAYFRKTHPYRKHIDSWWNFGKLALHFVESCINFLEAPNLIGFVVEVSLSEPSGKPYWTCRIMAFSKLCGRFDVLAYLDGSKLDLRTSN